MYMKVLWFPGNGAIYSNDNKYNGGGWTGSLAREIRHTHPEIELGMAIPCRESIKDDIDGIKIYGIPPIKHGFVNYSKKLSRQIILMKQIIEDFKPDIIHVFGSEHTGGMVATITDIPVVLHLQGILNFLKEAWLPQNMSWEKLILQHPKQIFQRKGLIRACETEKIILSHCHYFMGRTEMDSRVSRILSPRSEYYYCSEMLRPEIFNSTVEWSFHTRREKIVISIISSPSYKGGDVILRTAKILKEELGLLFQWHVYGITEMKDSVRLANIKCNDVGVKCCGVINAKTLVEAITSADVFVHPSYIENSSNSVCEAQALGIPVIACYVGGIPSIISNEETGVMVPASDPYMMASYIAELSINEEKAITMGASGRTAALSRHNPNKIVNDVINIYNEIVNHD